MSKLPQEMILDILCRLPVKSLLRFRSTSKHLCSVIDSPDFTKLHLHHSLLTHSNQSLILAMTAHLHSIDLRSADRAVEIEHPLKTVRGGTYVLGSCNGLLCLFNSEAEIVFWNMSTRQHHRLPYAPIISPNGAAASRHMVSTAGFGFGYDSVHDDYKLVRIVRFRGTLDSEVMVYSLKSNSWKMIQSFPYDFLSPVCVGVFADGALHWLADRLGRGGDVVAAFDLATEEFQVVPEPLQSPGETQALVQLGTWENRFCVIRIWAGKRVDMWAMKQYGVKESWTRVLSTSKPQITSASKCMVPLAHMMSNGNELVLLKDFQKLIRFDLRKNKVKFARILALPDHFDSFLYVESLVKPLVNVDDEAVGKNESKTGKKGKKNVTKRDGYSDFKLVL